MGGGVTSAAGAKIQPDRKEVKVEEEGDSEPEREPRTRWEEGLEALRPATPIRGGMPQLKSHRPHNGFTTNSRRIHDDISGVMSDVIRM